jgi:ABC-type branched-subunit amino acid transport system ATPase component
MHAVMELTDRVVVLNYGRVVAAGRPDEAMRQPEVLSAYLGHAHAAG